MLSKYLIFNDTGILSKEFNYFLNLYFFNKY